MDEGFPRCRRRNLAPGSPVDNRVPVAARSSPMVTNASPGHRFRGVWDQTPSPTRTTDDVLSGGKGEPQTTQNSLPSGSRMTTWSSRSPCRDREATEPPASTSTATMPSMRASRWGWSMWRPPATWRSRCSRFLAVLGSGTFRKLIEGSTPCGSSSDAPSPHSSSGTSKCRSQSSHVSQPFGGGASTYPRAIVQKCAIAAASWQSKVRVQRVVIGPPSGRVRFPTFPRGCHPGTMGAMQFGRSYEEFEVGSTYRHWPGKTVTEYDDHLFCLLTMNHHPLHLDAHYAAETTQFGKNVVVGNYVYSVVLGMSVPDVSGKAIANLEVESLRHVAPTFHGDTLYAETTVLDKRESTSKDDRGVVHVETIGYNQEGTVVCIFRRSVMVPKQSYLDARGGEQPGRPVPQPDRNWPGPART